MNPTPLPTNGHHLESFITKYRITIVCAIFTTGGWVTKIQLDLIAAEKEIKEQALEVKAIWRNIGEQKRRVEKTEWETANHRNRINSHEERLKLIERKPNP